jgi:hypothetical protein
MMSHHANNKSNSHRTQKTLLNALRHRLNVRLNDETRIHAVVLSTKRNIREREQESLFPVRLGLYKVANAKLQMSARYKKTVGEEALAR